MAFAGPDPAAARRSHRLRIATLVLGAGLLAWQSAGVRADRDRQLASPSTRRRPPVVMMVVSLASVRADALEVARLYHDGISGRIVLARWQDEPLDDDMRRLGVPWVPRMSSPSRCS